MVTALQRRLGIQVPFGNVLLRAIPDRTEEDAFFSLVDAVSSFVGGRNIEREALETVISDVIHVWGTLGDQILDFARVTASNNAYYRMVGLRPFSFANNPEEFIPAIRALEDVYPEMALNIPHITPNAMVNPLEWVAEALQFALMTNSLRHLANYPATRELVERLLKGRFLKDL